MKRPAGPLSRGAKDTKVARGEAGPNNLDSEPEVYAFVSHVEGTAEGEWQVDLQTVESVWMDNIWAYLLKTGVGPTFAKTLDGNAFAGVFPALAPDDKRVFFLLYLWFVKAVRDAEGEVFGRAPTGMCRFTLPPGDPLRAGLEECLWFHLDLEPASLDDSSRYQGPFIRIGESVSADQGSWVKVVPTSFERVEAASSKHKIMQSGLHALHFPQVDPLGIPDRDAPPEDGGGGGGGDDGGGDDRGGRGGSRRERPYEFPIPYKVPTLDVPPMIDPGPMQIPVFVRDWLSSGLQSLLEEASRVWRATLEGLRAFADDLSFPGPELQLAGAPGGAWRVPPRERRPLVDSTAQYIGSPATNTGHAGNNPWFGVAGAGNQAANPMIQTAGTQPFVGVLDVGQGSCNFLCNDADNVFAYFDFGYPTGLHGGGAPAAEPNPCLCHRPLIIISHWDYDHWALCRRNLESYRLEWIAPQQHMGTVEIGESIARILEFGGALHLWTGDGGGAGTHMTFPWGYVERETGPNPLNAGRRNTTGLVAYVCVRDQKGADAAITAAAPVDNSLAAPAVAQVGGGGAAAGCTQMVVGAPPVNWPATLNWANYQTSAINNWNARVAARDAAILVGVVANQARIEEIAAVTAACACAVFVHNGTAEPTDQECADIGLGAVDAYAALVLAGTPRSSANASIWLLAAAAPYPGYHAAIGAVGLLYALDAGLHSDLAVTAGDTQIQRIKRICTRTAAVLAGNLGGEVAVLGYLGLGDPGGNPAAKRRAIADGLVAIVRHACHPGPAVLHAGEIPKVQAGVAPFCANERFVLLTGDADFGLMPSQHQAPSPNVVGLVAAHHGSKQMDDRQLTAAQIPWARLSPEADAARAGRVSVVAGRVLARVVRDTGTPLCAAAPGGGLMANALADAAATGRAVEELLNAMTGAARNPLTGTPDNEKGIAAAAAAALVAFVTSNVLVLGAGPRNVAMATAAALGFQHCDEVHPFSIGAAAAHAAQATEGVIGAAAAVTFLLNATAGAAGEAAVDGRIAAALYWSASPGLGALSYSLGNVAVHASMVGWPFQAYFHVAGLPQGTRAAMGVPGAPATLGAFIDDLLPRVAGAAALGAVGAPAAGVAPPAGVMTWRQWAATFGAEVGVAFQYAIDPARLDAAARAAFNNTAPALPAAGAAGAGVIAYSYGVAGGGVHSHPAAPGGLGHPHPFSIQKYVAKGWTARRNTPDTTASRQPDASPWGPVALGWEDNSLVAVPMVPYDGALLTTGNNANGHASIAWTCVACAAPQITRLIV